MVATRAVLGSLGRLIRMSALRGSTTSTSGGRDPKRALTASIAWIASSSPVVRVSMWRKTKYAPVPASAPSATAMTTTTPSVAFTQMRMCKRPSGPSTRRRTPAPRQDIDEVHELPVPEVPRVAERRELPILVRNLPCREPLDEAPVVADEEILIPARQVEHRRRLHRNGRRQRAGIPLTTFGRLGSAKPLLRPRRHVHVRILSRDPERRAQRADRSEELRVLQAEQHGAPGAHRHTRDGAAPAYVAGSRTVAVRSPPSDALGTATKPERRERDGDSSHVSPAPEWDPVRPRSRPVRSQPRCRARGGRCRRQGRTRSTRRRRRRTTARSPGPPRSRPHATA